MKKLIFAAVLMLACFSNKIANAQISLSLNIGSQPDWGPVGYDHASYYYMPDIDAYYDVTNHLYVYNENNVWVHRAYLPERYHFDKYRSYKVVVNEPNPWDHAGDIRARYASYRGRTNQEVIRDSKEAKYRQHYREVAIRHREVTDQNRKIAVKNRQEAHHEEVVNNKKVRRAVIKHRQKIENEHH